MIDNNFSSRPTDSLVIALAKGRILKQTLPLFEQIGIVPTEDVAHSRKLMIATTNPKIKLLIVRTTDAPTYVQYGAADLGVSGRDTLIEHGYTGIFEMLDLGIARCKLMTAVLESVAHLPEKRLTVATKYVNSARKHFAEQGVHADIIKLYGSMELAPIVGLADCIVDLVDTGNTLKANGLKPLDTVLEVSTRLIVNRVSLKMKTDLITQLVADLRTVVSSREEA
ncbi:ATP phosphoribosyltransferase [Ostreibacterium oceani]|uniref:ATP phosphoribosyltransferase n=1 Tax=Ostreibacterium oceani TaxID=2654998 RepID=A0A6N7EVW1_9GAMM|nr:ATP phosphoribosyltransferase [Ostreibacterium oceani]MPV86691.1 ATP phosphoribosyltransferase [Ostreibacterium oceani]